MFKTTSYLNKPTKKTTTIDASGKILGKIAVEAADALRGKNKPTFSPHQPTENKVIIINAAKIRITGTKLEDKRYYRHSGYLGGIKSETLKEVMIKNPAEVIRRAVKGMLPKNRLQDIWLKNLQIFNENVK